MTEPTELTDLEGAALAVVARQGPVTRYAVAKAFADSPSEFSSGSAGAVYPLIKRLLARGLLQSQAARDGRRARTDYRVTPAGRKALRRWLLDAQRAAGLGHDPLRSRALHLDLVSSQERAAFFREVGRWMQAQTEEVVWPDDPRMQRVHSAVLAARRAWLQVLSELDQSPG